MLKTTSAIHVESDHAYAEFEAIIANRVASAQGPLFTMMFVAKAAGQGSVSVGKTVLKDPSMGAIPASGSQAMINVR